MTTLQVSRRFSFDAAHFLPGYPGKCRNLHGHRWEVEFTVEGRVSTATGMVFDFSELKKIVEPWIEELDHQLLNDRIPSIPTAEHLVLWFVERWSLSLCPRPLVRVRVWESPDSCVEWRADDR